MARQIQRKLKPEITAFFFILAANSLIILTADHFPYADGVNHLARYVLIKQTLFSDTPSGYDIVFHWVPSSYIALDLIFSTLLHVLSPAIMGKTIALLALNLPALGLYAVLRNKADSSKGLAMIGTLLGFNWYFFYGFMNYLIGLGLALLFIAWWWRRRDNPRRGATIAAAVCGTSLYLIHMSALAIVLVVTWLYALLTGLQMYRRTGKVDPEWLNRWKIPIVLLVSSITLFVIIRSTTMEAINPEFQTAFADFRSPLDKIKQLFSPFYIFSWKQMIIPAAIWFAAAAAISVQCLRERHADFFGWTALTFLTFFLIFPASVFGAYDADVRFLLPAYLLVFAGSLIRRIPRLMTWGLFAFCLAHAAVIHHYIERIDDKLSNFSGIIKTLPAESNTMALVVERSTGRTDPYKHFTLWHTILNNGVANGLFNRDATGSHVGHFEISNIPYHPGGYWHQHSHPPLDWPRISEEYDFVIRAGRNETAEKQLSAHGTLIEERGDISLYRLTDPNNAHPQFEPTPTD